MAPGSGRFDWLSGMPCPTAEDLTDRFDEEAGVEVRNTDDVTEATDHLRASAETPADTPGLPRTPSGLSSACFEFTTDPPCSSVPGQCRVGARSPPLPSLPPLPPTPPASPRLNRTRP